MRRKVIPLMLCLALLAAALPVGLIAAPALAQTTSVTVTKYAADGVTIIDQTTVDYSWMMSNLPVQGDNETHRYMQGPTFDPDNLWDPAETVNLKDKGILKGTDVKDLCNLVGGASEGDVIDIRASDDFGHSFQYENVYSPAPAQGPMVVCWYRSGEYVPTYDDGMQMVFFAQTTNGAGQYVFGNQDMHDCLPEDNWHFYGDYPSSNGLSVKYVSNISIYTAPPPVWDLTLEGATTDVISQGDFENGVACHGPVTWDDEGDIWSGMPLWLLVGWVDDATQHGPDAFNDALAAAGYNITVHADDGYSQTFSSADVARNNDMIVANILNGAPLPPDRYPLRLVGPDLAGFQKVGQIVRIELTDIPVITPTPEPTPTPVPQDWPLTLEGGLTDIVSQAEFEADVAANPASWDDGGNIWQGLALWRLAAKVDDDDPETFNDELATSGYDVIVIAADGYNKTFASADMAHNDNMIVANTLNSAPLSSDYYPLRLVGPELSGGQKVSQLVKIELDGVPEVSEGGCFIATAAYGSHLDSHVDTLRGFRDSHMQTDAVSSGLVSLYYRISPSIADFIDEHPAVKPVVRAALLPSVATSETAIGSDLAAKAAVLGFLGIVSVAAVAWVWRRRQLVNS